MIKASASKSSWTPQEALFAVLFSAIVCDGGIEPIERDVLLALIHRSRALKTLGDEEIEALNASISQKLHFGGDEALKDACQTLPHSLRLPVFAQALDIVLADGDLAQEESAFLNRLAAYLQLAEPDVRRIAEVIILKNTV
jgi:uncharacterized tellurite resistance protein B-like protein